MKLSDQKQRRSSKSEREINEIDRKVTANHAVQLKRQTDWQLGRKLTFTIESHCKLINLTEMRLA
jgi:lipopolysaccharide export system protein LptC